MISGDPRGGREDKHTSESVCVICWVFFFFFFLCLCFISFFYSAGFIFFYNCSVEQDVLKSTEEYRVERDERME